MGNRKVIFAYNADKDPINGTIDVLHKWFSPSTYQCSLCALTYGNFTMRGEWKRFLENDVPDRRFVYQKQFRSEFRELQDYDLPLIIISCSEKNKVVITSEELRKLSLEALIARMREELKS